MLLPVGILGKSSLVYSRYD